MAAIPHWWACHRWLGGGRAWLIMAGVSGGSADRCRNRQVMFGSVSEKQCKTILGKLTTSPDLSWESNKDFAGGRKTLAVCEQRPGINHVDAKAHSMTSILGPSFRGAVPPVATTVARVPPTGSCEAFKISSKTKLMATLDHGSSTAAALCTQGTLAGASAGFPKSPIPRPSVLPFQPFSSQGAHTKSVPEGSLKRVKPRSACCNPPRC